MKTFALFKGTRQLDTTFADDIDHALDIFFPALRVDVNLETCTPHRLDVRPLHARRSIAHFVIEELDGVSIETPSE